MVLVGLDHHFIDNAAQSREPGHISIGAPVQQTGHRKVVFRGQALSQLGEKFRIARQQGEASRPARARAARKPPGKPAASCHFSSAHASHTILEQRGSWQEKGTAIAVPFSFGLGRGDQSSDFRNAGM